MSQTCSPSTQRCYGLARVCRVWELARSTVYLGQARPWKVGLMYRKDLRLGRALLELLRQDASLHAGDNQPYAISNDTDYTIPVHAEARRLPHVGIEIRQDLITDMHGQQEWATRLAQLLPLAGKGIQ